MKTLKPLLSISTIAALLLSPMQPAIAQAKSGSTPAMDMARQLNQAFIDVADKISPAVVVITVVQKSSGRGTDDEMGGLWDFLPPEMRRYFEEHAPRGGDRNQQRRTPRRAPTGRGSGIVISEDGYILTNNHVVEDADKITVRFKNSKEFPAEVKGRDPNSDLAVIKIKDAKGLVPAKLGDSDAARVGEFAVAIGAPFDLSYSVTVGHISAKGRAFAEFGPYADQDFIQTDASINPGNSGGPLVNLYGEVIGINTMIRGIGTGIGFAVPSNIAKKVTDLLIKQGKVTRSRIGIEIADLRENPDIKAEFPSIEDGVVVRGVLTDGPAAKSDLKPGDVVVGVDGKTVKTSRELKEQVSYKRPGDTVTLDVVRPEAKGKVDKLKVKVKTEELPADENATGKSSANTNEESADFGMTVKSLTSDIADELGIDQKQGVVVTAVDPGSVAEQRGISAGDVITAVNRQPVTNLRQFRDAMKAADKKRGVSINYISKGSSRFTVLKEE